MVRSEVRISVDNGWAIVQRGDRLARARADQIRFGHLGCKLLGKLRPDWEKSGDERAAQLIAEWDRTLPREWRSQTNATAKVAGAMIAACRCSGCSGVELCDTMRWGSDVWRFGALLTDAAERVRAAGFSAGYQREDDTCPPAELLERHRTTETESFAVYAEGYAGAVRSGPGLKAAMAMVIEALALDRLPLFLCTDAYVPNYISSGALLADTPHAEKPWAEGELFRRLGCHRVVLAVEVARGFRELGLASTIIEGDATFQTALVRRFSA